MKMESKRAARCGASNMAPTGEMKNVEHENDDWARHRAEIVNILKRDGVPKNRDDDVPDNREASAFGVLALLAPLDAIRLKLIARIFTAMSPFAEEGVAPAQDDYADDWEHVASGIWEHHRAEIVALLKGEKVLVPKPPRQRRRRRKRSNNVIALKPRLCIPKGDDSPKVS
jgi:hypothetical protein